MAREEARKRLEVYLICAQCPEDKECYDSYLHSTCEYNDCREEVSLAEAIRTAIKALEQEPCEDVISREPFTDSTICEGFSCDECSFNRKDKGGCILEERVMNLPSAKQEPKTGHCKECKYFEYDSVAKVDGIPLIVAHEICKRWGDGCKTKEDGYCFLYEPQERSDK